MALSRLAITVEGVTPLLLNRFSDEAAMEADRGNRQITRDKGTPAEQAESKLYKSGDNEKTLIIPIPNVLSCITDAGKFFKIGRRAVTTQQTSIIPGAVDFTSVQTPLIYKQKWRVDTRAVRIPATGGRILAHRPCFDDWKLAFELMLDTDIIPVKLFREIVDAAGKRTGLGDFRPAKKGPFGKFAVTSWKAAA